VEGPPEPGFEYEGQGPYGSTAVESPVVLYNKWFYYLSGVYKEDTGYILADPLLKQHILAFRL